MQHLVGVGLKGVVLGICFLKFFYSPSSFVDAGENCWKYALESTGFDPLVGSDGFDLLWCKSPNGPQML
jgi:hypothetical protein